MVVGDAASVVTSFFSSSGPALGGGEKGEKASFLPCSVSNIQKPTCICIYVCAYTYTVRMQDTECARACVRACVRAYVRVCVGATSKGGLLWVVCVRACVCVCVRRSMFSRRAAVMCCAVL